MGTRHYQLTPDGLWYLKMMEGQAAPMPFAARWLIPTVARLFGGEKALVLSARLSIVIAVAVTLATLWQVNLSPQRIALAGAIVIFNPWLGKWLWRCPILTDQFMHLAVSIGVYGCVTRNPAIVLAAIFMATCAREYGALLILSVVPLFLGLAWTWTCLLLTAGTYAILKAAANTCPPQPLPGWEKFFGPKLKVARHCLAYHGWRFMNPLATWGLIGAMAILGAMNAPTDVLRLIPMIAVAWVQPLLGSDFERLQSHAWPAVIALAVCL